MGLHSGKYVNVSTACTNISKLSSLDAINYNKINTSIPVENAYYKN